MKPITEEFGSLFAASDDASSPEQKEPEPITLQIVGASIGAVKMLDEALGDVSHNSPLPDDARAIAYEIAELLDENETPLDITIGDDGSSDATAIHINLVAKDESELVCVFSEITIDTSDSTAYITAYVIFNGNADERLALDTANRLNSSLFRIFSAYAEEDESGWGVTIGTKAIRLDEPDLSELLYSHVMTLLNELNGLFYL